MPLTANEAWSRLLDQAKQQLPLQTFRTWLEPTVALAFENDIIYVSVPDQFAADWNESKHSALLGGLAPVALGHPVSVIFKVNEERKARSQMDFFVAPPPSVKTATSSYKGNIAPLSSRYTFDHFVIGKSNELAAAAAQAVAQVPGKVYNPLFLYGDTGVGKTHLMQAIAHAILQKTPTIRITFIGTEQFTNDLVASIQGRTTADFRKRYRETDLLLIDDVHFLKGKEATQEEFFHTFNALYEGGRQIVLTSDRPASEIPGLEARLVSRFQWGMVADIKLPDLEHRIAILRHKAQLDHLELTIPDDVTRFIAENIRSNVRELEGAVIKLLAYASLRHREITVDVAKEALRDKLLDQTGSLIADSRTITITLIQQLVASEWNVTIDGLKSKTRTKSLTVPRQVAMYLTRELLGTQLVEIGNAFGGRDHSTVIHSLDRVNSNLETNIDLQKRVAQLRLYLKSI